MYLLDLDNTITCFYKLSNAIVFVDLNLMKVIFLKHIKTLVMFNYMTYLIIYIKHLIVLSINPIREPIKFLQTDFTFSLLMLILIGVIEC